MVPYCYSQSHLVRIITTSGEQCLLLFQPENILCLTKTGNRIKIIDFGLARVHNPAVDTRVLFGTPEFMAPEVVQYEPIHFATDMWSVGVICYVLYARTSVVSRWSAKCGTRCWTKYESKRIYVSHRCSPVAYLPVFHFPAVDFSVSLLRV